MKYLLFITLLLASIAITLNHAKEEYRLGRSATADGVGPELPPLTSWTQPTEPIPDYAQGAATLSQFWERQKAFNENQYPCCCSKTVSDGNGGTYRVVICRNPAKVTIVHTLAPGLAGPPNSLALTPLTPQSFTSQEYQGGPPPPADAGSPRWTGGTRTSNWLAGPPGSGVTVVLKTVAGNNSTNAVVTVGGLVLQLVNLQPQSNAECALMGCDC